MDTLWTVGGIVAVLLLGVELGRWSVTKSHATAQMAVDRVSPAELERFELAMEGYVDEVRHLIERTRKRLDRAEVPRRKPQDAFEEDGEASSIPPKLRAREKARRAGLWLGRLGFMASQSEPEDQKIS